MWNKNREFRKCIIVMLLIMALAAAAFNIFMKYVKRDMSNEYYAVIAKLLENAKEQYPEFNEQEWIKIFNEEYADYSVMQDLERYGIFPEDMPLLNQRKYIDRVIVVGNLLLLILSGGIMALICRYQKRRNSGIDEMTSYIRQIERGVYELETGTNREDELSGLKNELYKITVMLKESEKQSSASKRALADSVQDISHQLKTPLTSCLVLLDNLSESENMDEATRHKFLSEITRQITNINRLIITLLKLSRMDAGVVEFKKEKAALDDILEEIFEDLSVIAELEQIELKREGVRDAVIYGDGYWIKEALANLVKNAVEHSPVNSSVIVRVEDNTVYTAVSVIDFGEGIPYEEQKHIFERFYRSSTAAEDSIGIGLALCKAIVERQNGYITMSSEPGSRTEFLIKFLK